jgi:hypothetical protein
MFDKKIISGIGKEFLDFKRNFYGQFPSKICKNSKTFTGAGPDLTGHLPLPVPSLIHSDRRIVEILTYTPI